MDVPVLETDRLILRAHTADDFEALAALWADPAVVRHIGGTPSTRTEAWARLLRYRGLWPVLGFGYWAVSEKETGRFLGDAGLADFHRVIDPSIAGEAEAGWVFAGHAHGKGFATEAMTAVLAWFDARFPGRDAVCIIAPENAPSVRLAEKLCFALQVETVFMGGPTLLMRREAPIPPAP